MAKLMAKPLNGEWKQVDKTNPDSTYTEEEQKAHLMAEYRLIYPKDWELKWEEE